MENEKVDIAYDLRAEAPKAESPYHHVHSPIVDDADHQDESVKKSIDSVVSSYNEGKRFIFIAKVEVIEQELLPSVPFIFRTS